MKSRYMSAYSWASTEEAYMDRIAKKPGVNPVEARCQFLRLQNGKAFLDGQVMDISSYYLFYILKMLCLRYYEPDAGQCADRLCK